MIVTRRHLRFLFTAGLVWFAVECLLFWLLAGAIGFFPATFAMAFKGVVGFLLLASNVRKILAKVALSDLKTGLVAISDTSFAALGALLILLPGFLTTLVGLALFSPSIRMTLVRWLKREKKKGGGDGILSLDATEWREIKAPAAKSPGRKPKDRRVPPPNDLERSDRSV